MIYLTKTLLVSNLHVSADIRRIAVIMSAHRFEISPSSLQNFKLKISQSLDFHKGEEKGSIIIY